jgi:hypothetical protein
MNRNRHCLNLFRGAMFAALFSWAMQAGAHGGVVFEDDVCVIKIGFLMAHFTIYQPETSANEEFCEDIPEVTDTIFVLDYLHNSMKDMPVDFRIIRDVDDLGIYARLEDVEMMEDIERETVFYRRPTREFDSVLTVDHAFAEPGAYIGIVTAQHPTLERTYSAVFPFRVGGSGFGYLPLFLLLGVVAQLAYWMSNGTLARWREKMVGG